MNRHHLRDLVAGRRAWSEPLSSDALSRGFRGWYSSSYLPHFDSPATRQSITYRLHDSIPASRRREWEDALAMEDAAAKAGRIETFLDSGLGQCHLRDPRIATIVQENLWHHDDRSYRLLAWCIMPNHVHVLIEQMQTPLGDILKNWKSYTSKQANRVLGRSGAFWAEDYFDRYIRDESHYYRVHYIENNPLKARLASSANEWPWSSAAYRSQPDIFAAPAVTHPKAASRGTATKPGTGRPRSEKSEERK